MDKRSIQQIGKKAFLKYFVLGYIILTSISLLTMLFLYANNWVINVGCKQANVFTALSILIKIAILFLISGFIGGFLTHQIQERPKLKYIISGSTFLFTWLLFFCIPFLIPYVYLFDNATIKTFNTHLISGIIHALLFFYPLTKEIERKVI